jgi:hypothetical protein
VAVVADRGMISKAVVEALESEELGCPYILGVRMRSAAMVGDSLLKGVPSASVRDGFRTARAG